MRVVLVPAALAASLLALTGAAADDAGFCVVDADDVLWVDCETAAGGISVNVQCRRDTKPLTPRVVVEAPVQRLAPGEGRCPAGGSAARGLTTEGIPRDRNGAAPTAADD